MGKDFKQPPQKDKNPQLSQTFSFSATYQYEGNRSAKAIEQAVWQNFLFPCWAQKDVSKGQSYLSMLDVRSFIVDKEQNQIQFVYEDYEEMTQIMQLQQNQMQGKINRVVIEAKNLYENWKKKKTEIQSLSVTDESNLIFFSKKYKQIKEEQLKDYNAQVITIIEVEKNMRNNFKESVEFMKELRLFSERSSNHSEKCKQLLKQYENMVRKLYVHGHFLFKDFQRYKNQLQKMDFFEEKNNLLQILPKKCNIFIKINHLQDQWNQNSPKSLENKKLQQQKNFNDEITKCRQYMNILLEKESKKEKKSLLSEILVKFTQILKELEKFDNQVSSFKLFKELENLFSEIQLIRQEWNQFKSLYKQRSQKNQGNQGEQKEKGKLIGQFKKIMEKINYNEYSYFFNKWFQIKKQLLQIEGYLLEEDQRLEEVIDQINDVNDDDGHKEIKKNKKNENNLLDDDLKEIKNFKKQAFDLQRKWKKIKYIWRDIWSKDEKFKNWMLNEKKLLKIYLFQKLRSTKSSNILQGEYLLICKEKKQLQRIEINLVIPWKNHFIGQQIVQLQFTMISKKQPLSSNRYSCKSEYQNVKELIISFKSTQENKIFLKNQFQIDQNAISYYFQIEPALSRNRIIFPYQQGKFQRNKIYMSKHFHLAFQGGGAKGVAYVGAYKAILNHQKQQSMPIPIKSIMGSSAGGIIALAISSGISEEQLQRICSKMNKIPSMDKISQLSALDFPAKDSYGNQLEQNQLISKLKKILHQYGVISQKLMKKLSNKLEELKKEEKFYNLLTELMEWAAVSYPAIAQILVQQKRTTLNWKDFWLFPKSKVVDYKFLNYEGLLLHGALMKGDSIHNIAADCLIRFLLKKNGYSPEDPFFKLKAFLSKTLDHNDLPLPPNSPDLLSSKLAKKLQDYMNSINNLLNINLTSIIELFEAEDRIIAREDQKMLKKIIAELYNSYVILNGEDMAQGLHINRQIIFDENHNFEDKCLINPKKIFDLEQYKAKMQNKTIEILFQIPNINYQEMNQVNEQQIVRWQFLRLEIGDKILQILKKYNVFLIPDNKHPNVPDLGQIKQKIRNCQETMKELKKVVGKITMKQYYCMTNVELSCTSVDLDNKTLRFFNHKTTPNLPVCKAVQMTGSFPVAFKAQKWQQQWGYYEVHLVGRKMLVNITDHEFTDGGLLANFPIRYMNNEEMRSRYFCAKNVKGKTILLGFGLDSLSSEQYEMNQKQIKQAKQQKIKGKSIPIDYSFLTSWISKLKIVGAYCGEKIGNFFLGKDTDIVKWLDIDHYLIKEIPLIKFLMKVSAAYPNADRNLNLQAFENRVLNQVIGSRWIYSANYGENKKYQGRAFLKEFINEYSEHIQRVQALNFNQNQITFSNYPLRRQITNKMAQLIQKNCNQNKEKVTQLHAAFSTMIQNQIQKGVFSYKSNKDQEENLKQIPQLRIDQASTSYRLIKILFLHLSMPQNASLALKYSKQYAKLRYQIQYLADHQDRFQQLGKENMDIVLNEINFVNFFEGKNYEEIQMRCDKHDYYKDIASKMFKEGYKQQQQKKADLKSLLKTSDKTHFFKAQYFDVRSDIKLLVEYLFLVIKMKVQNLNPNNRIKALNRKIQTTNYYSLLMGRNENQQYLTYDDIVKFLQDQFIRINNLRSQNGHLRFSRQLVEYVRAYSSDQRLTSLYKSYIKNLISHEPSGLIFPVQNQNWENKFVWFQKGYQHFRKYQTIKQGKEYIRHLIKDSRLRQILVQFIRQNIYQGQLQQNFEQKISSFLTFIACDEDKLQDRCIIAQISREKSEYLLRQKSKALELLYMVLLKFFYANHSAQQINRYIDINVERFLPTANQNSHVQSIKSHISQTLAKNIDCHQDIEAKFYTANAFLVNIEVDTLRWYFNQILVPNSQFKQKYVTAEEWYSFGPEQKLVAVNWSDDKQQLSKEGQQKKLLQRLNNIYYQSMNIVLKMLEEAVLIVKAIRIEKNESNEWRLLSKRINGLYRSIFHMFRDRYFKLHDMPLNLITQSQLGNVFILEYSFIEEMYYIKQRIIELDLNLEVKPGLLKHIFENLVKQKRPIPFFNADCTLVCQTHDKMFKKKVINIFAQQNNNINKDFTEELQHFSTQAQRQRNQNSQIASLDTNTHLLLEGVKISHEFFGGMYEAISNIIFQFDKNIYPNADQEKLRKNRIQSIKMITCANFHSIFGFLLSMGYPIKLIRRQMFKVEEMASDMVDKKQIEAQFNSCTWGAKNMKSYNELFQYLQKEHRSLFARIEQLKKNDYRNRSLQHDFKSLSLQYEQQKSDLMKTYQRIIDEIADSMKIIEGKFVPHDYPLKISQRFGFNYKCSENFNHNYSETASSSFTKFKESKNILFSVFGTLVQEVIGNIFIEKSTLGITEDNVKYVVKGLIINRLLTTFKLKEYVISKLKQQRLNPNISLKQYYISSQRRIFLNFTVLDVSKQRLTFLNKNTMPNMPLWAAILATSSLPFLHKFFEANKDWDSPDAMHFHQFFIYEFFKDDPRANDRITKYTTGNYISSLPMELLTNNTIKEKILYSKKDEEFKNLKLLAICFTEEQKSNEVVNGEVQRYVLDLQAAKKFKQVMESPKQYVHKNHNNKFYDAGRSIFAYPKDWLHSNNLSDCMSLLTNSNDNLIMKLYYDKLIRLPIKFETLQFQEIVDKNIFETCNISILSDKSKETIERSYQITKYFISQIGNRVICADLFKKFQQKMKNSASIDDRLLISSYRYANFREQMINRFKVKMRVQMFKKQDNSFGNTNNFCKIIFLNHSKWNQNNFNNYSVECYVCGEEYLFKAPEYVKAKDSEFVWPLQLNDKIKVRFFYSVYEQRQKKNRRRRVNAGQEQTEQFQKILFTQFKMNFSRLKAPLQNDLSYDYEFVFGWEKGVEQEIGKKWLFKATDFVDLKPIRKNGVYLKENNNGPTLGVKLIYKQEENEIMVNEIIQRTSQIVRL